MPPADLSFAQSIPSFNRFNPEGKNPRAPRSYTGRSDINSRAKKLFDI
jgi:hypothetical protein